jgi:hypothetical protein
MTARTRSSLQRRMPEPSRTTSMVVAACGLRRMVIMLGIRGCPFPTGDQPSRRKGMRTAQELWPHQEAEVRTEVDHRGRPGSWGNIHGLHQYAPRSLQRPQFQRQSQQRWQAGVVRLSVNTPVSSQLSKKLSAASAAKGRSTPRQSSSIDESGGKGGFRRVRSRTRGGLTPSAGSAVQDACRLQAWRIHSLTLVA